MKDKIKLLSLDYDLKPISNAELTSTLMEVCAVYIECMHGNSTSAGDALIRVAYVSEEVIRRRDMEVMLSVIAVQCRYWI